MANNESMKKVLTVAVLLCLVCSIVVSSAAVLLRDAQQANKELDKKRNILAAAGLFIEGTSVDEQFQRIEARIIDLDTGLFTDVVDVATYDQRKAAKNPSLSDPLGDEDIAKISRRVKYATIYLVRDESGIDKLILPIKGYGLWSTLYGFLALESDFNTVAGLGFYEHGETPGLGGEVDNPRWKGKWPGKKIYDKNQGVKIALIKGSVDTSKAGAEYRIDGLSGATLTTRGVQNLIHFWMGDSGFAKFLTNLKAGEA